MELIKKKRFHCAICYSGRYAIPVEIHGIFPIVGEITIYVCQDCAQLGVEKHNEEFDSVDIELSGEFELEIACGDKTIKLSGVKPLGDTTDMSCAVPIKDPFNFKILGVESAKMKREDTANEALRIHEECMDNHGEEYAAAMKEDWKKRMQDRYGINYSWEKLRMYREKAQQTASEIECQMIDKVLDFVKNQSFTMRLTATRDCGRSVYQTNMYREAADRVFGELDTAFPGWRSVILIRPIIGYV